MLSRILGQFPWPVTPMSLRELVRGCMPNVLTLVASTLASRYLDHEVNVRLASPGSHATSLPVQAERTSGAIGVQDRVLAVIFESLGVLSVRSLEVFFCEEGVSLRFEEVCLRGG
jgi:hypothetical protein